MILGQVSKVKISLILRKMCDVLVCVPEYDPLLAQHLAVISLYLVAQETAGESTRQ